jgi:rieske iron-sulfur protein
MAARNGSGVTLDRRTALLGMAGCCLAGPAFAGPEEELPQKGDTLVFADGDSEGKPIVLASLKEAEPVLATAVAPGGIQRTESRFAKIVLVRVPAADLDEDTKPHAADNVVALSAICTHQGCTVNGWDPANKALLCFCHGSEFVPGEGGRVAKGPARKRIPVLPLAANDKGEALVAGGFLGKPGPGA